jgi:hypothetical protein
MAHAFIGVGFSNAYSAFNTTNQIAASHDEFTRALITVGYQSLGAAVATAGMWRAGGLACFAKGYLDAALQTTHHFQSLEQSERSAMTFLFGQAAAYLFAQHIGLYFLVHVNGTAPSWTRAAPGSVAKIGAGVPKALSRPDFFGLGPDGWHVFEAKGRTGKLRTKHFKAALAQVAAVGKLNGLDPVTRVACIAQFSSSGMTGEARDPPGDDLVEDIYFDEGAALRLLYGIFLNHSNYIEAHFAGVNYAMLKLDDDTEYGIDADLLAMLRRRADITEVKNYLALRQESYWAARLGNMSVGREGIVLRSSTGPSRNPPQMKPWDGPWPLPENSPIRGGR